MNINNNIDIREIIIERSRTIFAQYGLKKTTMDEIAHAVYKAKSSIYYYFNSKEEIFQAVLEREGELFKKEMDKELLEDNIPQKKLRIYIYTRMLLFHKLSNYYCLFINDVKENYPFIEKLIKLHDENEHKWISAILQEGIDSKIFAVRNLRQTTTALILALKGLEIPISPEKSQDKINDNIDALLRIIFNGLEIR